MKLQAFSAILNDCTSKYNKIKKEDYISEGQFPIIDQGQKFIGGYTNDGGLITDIEEEIIIFGDHTKIVKFIDFPIAIGADGVKVLHVNREKADARYIYYFLKSVKLTDAGYSRHFKFLKEIKIPLPENIDDQIKTARLLNHIETLITQRKESIILLDELLKSSFVKMFDKPNQFSKTDDIKTIGQICHFKGGGTPSKSKLEYFTGDIPWVSPKDMKYLYITTSKDKITEKAIKESATSLIAKGAVLMVVRSGILKSKLPVAINLVDVTINQDMKAFISNEVLSSYLLYYFIINEKSILKKVRATTADNFNFDDIKRLKIVVPPSELQNQFDNKVKKVESLKEKYKVSLKELENMYDSLSQIAFRTEFLFNVESDEAKKKK
jgi:type I restriction enzyme S subunit